MSPRLDAGSCYALLALFFLGTQSRVFAQFLNSDGEQVSRLSISRLPKAPSLQELVDAPGNIVNVPAADYTLEVPLVLRSNLILKLEPGTRIVAAKGAFRGIEDSLLVMAGVQNVTLEATGCIFSMRKDDYRDRTLYKPSEWRHVLTIRGGRDITINGGQYESSGGDGIYIGPLISSTQRIPCENVRIFGVTCYNNYRQGVSVLGGHNLLIADSIFSGTIGTSPQAGIDVEPEYGDSVDVVVRDCLSKGNRGPAYMMNLSKVTPARSIRIEFQYCDAVGVPRDQLDFRPVGVFDDRGRLLENLPVGTYISWNGLIWRK